MSTEVVSVKIDSLKANAWNPNVVPDHIIESLANNVRRVDFNQPILVRPRKDGGYEIVDGEHRWKAAKMMGMKEVPVIIRELDDAEAMAQTIAMNKLRGEMDPADVAALVRDIEGEGLKIDELARFTGYKEEELDALVKLADFDFNSFEQDVVDAEPDGEEQWITMTFRMPSSVVDIVQSEIDRLKGILETDHDFRSLEYMAVASSHITAEEVA